MKKKTAYYEFKKPEGFIIYNVYDFDGDWSHDTPDYDYFSDDIKLITGNNSTFFNQLYNFVVKKYNIKFKKVIRVWNKSSWWTAIGNAHSILLFVNIKPSGIFVSYAPFHEEDYPKKRFKELYGRFKIDKVDMLKFLNNYIKKRNVTESGLFRNISDHPDYPNLKEIVKRFKELKKRLKQVSTTMIKQINSGEEKITKLIGHLELEKL